VTNGGSKTATSLGDMTTASTFGKTQAKQSAFQKRNSSEAQLIKRTPSAQSVKQLKEGVYNEPDSQALVDSYSTMRETVHNLQLKDAIHRQTIQKLQRESDEFRTENKDFRIRIEKLERERDRDGEYLIKQEEELSKLRVAGKTKGSAAEISKVKDANEKLKIEKTNMEAFVNEAIGINQQRDEIDTLARNIEGILTSNKQLSESKMIEILKNQVKIYEKKLSERDSDTKLSREFYIHENQKLKEENEKLGSQFSDMKRDRVEDQKLIFELERRLGFVQIEQEVNKEVAASDDLLTKDMNQEQTEAKNKADDILGRLKMKLAASSSEDFDEQRFLKLLSNGNSFQFTSQKNYS